MIYLNSILCRESALRLDKMAEFIQSARNYLASNNKKEYFYPVANKFAKDEILEEEGKIQVECHFCGKKYEFIKSDFNDWSQN